MRDERCFSRSKEIADIHEAQLRRRPRVDRLAWTAVLAPTRSSAVRPGGRSAALAASAGIRPTSIHDLYMAMGRGEAGGFTVPAINVRAMAYDTARAVIRSAKELNAGAFIFEIARSEIGYTEQRPHEYVAVVLAAALREGFTGPLFIQGDHVQTNAKKFSSPDRDRELDTLRALIKEEIAAGFFNIDIDTSTLVDLSKPTLDEQQEVNVAMAAEFAAFIRQNEPRGRHGVGRRRDRRSRGQELRRARAARVHGRVQPQARRSRRFTRRPEQDQRADGHGPRRIRQRRRDGPNRREDRRQNARGAVAYCPQGVRTGGAVQHGASTLPLDAFDAFPRVGACEIHLATDFQNMVYEHPRFPAELKAEMYAWLRENATEERKPKDTEEQFIYKARKKAIGPFKQRMWSISDDARSAIGRSLEERFTFLMKQLRIENTVDAVRKFVKVVEVPFDRDAEIVAAGGTITAAEKKAEGLAD